MNVCDVSFTHTYVYFKKYFKHTTLYFGYYGATIVVVNLLLSYAKTFRVLFFAVLRDRLFINVDY